MITFVRVDNRLIHGQVVETWIPHLKVKRVVVADDEAAGSPLIRAAMGLAVQGSLEVLIEPLESLDYAGLHADPVRTLLLMREITDVMRARRKGLQPTHVNLGNVHFATGRLQISPSVFLSPEEVEQLQALAAAGAEVEARAVPGDRAIDLKEIQSRAGKPGA